MEFTKDMLVGDILRANPESARVLMEMGLSCIGCPGSQMESIEEAAMVHGLDVNVMLEKLNALNA